MLSSGSTNIAEYGGLKSRVRILLVLSDENDLDVFKEYTFRIYNICELEFM